MSTGVSRTSEPRLGLLVQFGLLAGPFLSMVDSNVVNVAIPQIARAFGDPLSRVQWTVSGYLLAMATGLAASAYLARRYGTREVYIASLVGFTLASGACALAASTPMLVVSRIAQGLLGAPLVPLAMSMLLGGGGARQRMSPVAGILLFLAPALGPTLGGLLVSGLGWQSVFLINVPFGLVGLAGVLAMSRDLAPAANRGVSLDPVGLVLLSAALFLTTYGASQGPADSWFSAGALPFWGGGLLLLLGYGGWAFTRPDPVVDLKILKLRDPGLAVGLSVIAGSVLFAVLFLMPVFVQQVQGGSAAEAGLLLLPQGLVMAFGTVLGDLLTKRRLVRPSVIAGMVVLAGTTAVLTLVEPHTPAWMTALVLCGRGLALGMIIQPLLVATLGELPPADLADANTLFNIVERVAGSFGVALVATFFQTRVRAHVAETLAGPVASAGARLQTAATAGFHDTVWLLVGLAVSGVLGALLLSSRLDKTARSSLQEASGAADTDPSATIRAGAQSR